MTIINTKYKANDCIYVYYKNKGDDTFVIYKILEVGLTVVDGVDISYYSLKPVFLEKGIRHIVNQKTNDIFKYYAAEIDKAERVRLLTPTEQVLYSCK